MKKFFILFLCFIIFCFLIIKSSIVKGGNTNPDDNLIIIHGNAPDHSSDCTVCHGDRTDEKSLDPKIPSIHTTHLKQKTFKDKGCVYCHKSVDLEEASAATLRKQVDVQQTCLKCHEKKFYKGGGSK